MKHNKPTIILSLTAAWLLGAMTSCDDYDDTRLRHDLDELGQELAAYEQLSSQLNEQMAQITALADAAYITFVSTDADGNYVVTYADANGASHTFTVATAAATVQQPIVTARADADGTYYWAVTSDNGRTYQFVVDGSGAKFPVSGTPPLLTIDDQGFWCVNGVSTGSAAYDVGSVLFRRVYVDPESGEAVFVLADGAELRMTLREALGLRFNSPLFVGVADYATPVLVAYEVYGAQAANASVDLFAAYNMEVAVDRRAATISAKMKEGATEGTVMMLAHAGNHTLLKPLYFTYGEAVIGAAAPDGTARIGIAGKASQVEVQVSASIAYDVASSAPWLVHAGSRAVVATTQLFDAAQNDTGDERRATLTFSNTLYNISTAIEVVQDPMDDVAKGGIASAADMVAFARAVNAGGSLARWQNDAGEIVLLNDIDMSTVDEWTPIGDINNSSYSTANPYAAVNPFTGTFDGKGFAIKGMNWAVDITGRQVFALFGAIENAVVKNVVVGDPAGSDTWTLTGTAKKQGNYAPLVGFAKGSTVASCTNNVNIDFKADNLTGELCVVTGLTGTIMATTVGGEAKSEGCHNNGNVIVGAIANTGNGGTGMQTAGICGVMAKCAGNKVAQCVNYGHLASPSGREGGIVATIFLGNIVSCSNYGTVEDDLVGQHAGKEANITVTYKRIGGILGGSDDLRKLPENTVEGCTNHGNVMSHLSARTGGIAGHSNISLIGCANNGAVLSDLFIEANGTNRHGPGWLCGYSRASSSTWTNATQCVRGGYVGDYTAYKDDPTSAPEATNDNAFCHNYSSYNPEINY